MEPSEPPPSYTAATGSTTSSTTNSNPQHQSQDLSRLQIPQQHEGAIPAADRRSMEDESRSLPPNWVRQYDHKTHHQFFVDTSATPPRSIWHHPYDDEEYMSTLSPSQRDEIRNQYQHSPPSPAYEDEGFAAQQEHHNADPTSSGTGTAEPVTGVHKFGRKMKDKLTSSTHEEREAERRRRDAEDARLYRQHQHIRAQMSKAAETGVPQLLGTDRNGKEVYIEPPQGFGYGGGGGRGMYANNGGYTIDPYGGQYYSRPNARYVRPQVQYGRPYGYGYGGGMGAPLLGLGGGMLLGGLLF